MEKSLLTLKTNSNLLEIKPSEIEGFILEKYGVSCDVVILKGNPVIKVYNQYTLFSIIQKIRKDFDFTVHHSFKKNEFIIILGNSSSV